MYILKKKEKGKKYLNDNVKNKIKNKQLSFNYVFIKVKEFRKHFDKTVLCCQTVHINNCKSAEKIYLMQL